MNLIKVSNMLSGNSEICDLPKLKPGARVNWVLSRITSDNPDDVITAVVAVAIGEELGCVVETSGINGDSNDLVNEAEEIVRYMMEKRKVEIKKLIIEYSTTQVKNIASCIASVVYLDKDIVEKS